MKLDDALLLVRENIKKVDNVRLFSVFVGPKSDFDKWIMFCWYHNSVMPNTFLKALNDGFFNQYLTGGDFEVYVFNSSNIGWVDGDTLLFVYTLNDHLLEEEKE